MKKIGVISDTHLSSAPFRIPPQVETGFEGVDLILHAGDLVNPGLLDDLELIAPVRAVRGNCDTIMDDRVLPYMRLLKVENCRIGLIHSLGKNTSGFYSNALKEFGERADCVVFGHSHKTYNERYAGVLLFNPGSPTQCRSQPCHSYGILTVTGSDIEGEVVMF